jgi:serine/threonine protein kinase
MDSLQPGDPQKIGPYVPRGRLGAGGMGEVFFGYSPGGRPVAVKLIHRALAADPAFRRRFRQEAEAARKVGGFHTAQVVDVQSDADRPEAIRLAALADQIGTPDQRRQRSLIDDAV